jgi:hypothetical protein
MKIEEYFESKLPESKFEKREKNIWEYNWIKVLYENKVPFCYRTAFNNRIRKEYVTKKRNCLKIDCSFLIGSYDDLYCSFGIPLKKEREDRKSTLMPQYPCIACISTNHDDLYPIIINKCRDEDWENLYYDNLIDEINNKT